MKEKIGNGTPIHVLKSKIIYFKTRTGSTILAWGIEEPGVDQKLRRYATHRRYRIFPNDVLVQADRDEPEGGAGGSDAAVCPDTGLLQEELCLAQLCRYWRIKEKETCGSTQCCGAGAAWSRHF